MARRVFLDDPEETHGPSLPYTTNQCQADSHDAHGAPLGADEAEATRKQPGTTLRGFGLIVRWGLVNFGKKMQVTG